MTAVWVTEPPVALMVTLPRRGVGACGVEEVLPLPPPPQESAPNITHNSGSPSKMLRQARTERRMRFGLAAKTMPREKTRVA